MDMHEPVANARTPSDMNTLLDRLLTEVEQEGDRTPDAAAPVAAEVIPNAPAGGEGAASPLIGTLLSNPALLSAVPTLLENLSPLLGSLRASGTSSKGSDAAQSGSQSGSQSVLPSRYPVDRHTALLCALKPYLSSGRQATAENVIRLCRVWDALGRSGISLSGLLSGLGGIAPSPPPAGGVLPVQVPTVGPSGKEDPHVQ